MDHQKHNIEKYGAQTKQENKQELEKKGKIQEGSPHKESELKKGNVKEESNVQKAPSEAQGKTAGKKGTGKTVEKKPATKKTKKETKPVQNVEFQGWGNFTF